VTNIESRLLACFAGVFSELPPGDLRRASTSSIAAWDSLAAVTLLAVVEEEFGVTVEPDALDQFVSFDLILSYLREREARADA